MKKVRIWRSSCKDYLDLVSIECASFNPDVIKIIEQMYLPDLRYCPNEIIHTAVIVPRVALQFLLLGDIAHRIVVLRSVESLSSAVSRMLHERFLRGQEPHYYRYGERVVHAYVLKATIRHIGLELHGTRRVATR